jgi:hypothetical protein
LGVKGEHLALLIPFIADELDGLKTLYGLKGAPTFTVGPSETDLRANAPADFATRRHTD